MYKFKEVVRRGSALAGAVGLLAGIGTSVLPALASADTLNPLTERSLTLSSSSPGWSFTDGSGNGLYAPPNSGANGQKTGNYYSFKPSSTGSINALTLQYCTTSAGNCTAPGDDGHTSGVRNGDTTTHSDLAIATSSPAEISSSDWTTISGSGSQIPNRNDSQGNFVVLVGGAYSSGWTMTAANQEEGGTIGAGTATGKVNMFTLKNTSNSGAGVTFTGGQQIMVKFFATDNNYITNPGSGAFFVKINSYEGTITGSGPYTIGDVNAAVGSTHIVDGGVTVANVMNQSIAIQTKVLETMEFSVGTVDPDTLTSDGSTTPGSNNELYTANGNAQHGQCDPILTRLSSSDPQNILYMGNTNAEHSLETGNTYGTHSLWRLSSNSSGGATVYYAGNTLYNTEGDYIAPINTASPGNKTTPLRGTPQFGLAIDNDATASHFYVNHDNALNTSSSPTVNYDYGVDNATTKNGALDDVDATYSWNAVKTSLSAHDPQLYPLVATTNYNEGGGTGGLFNPTLGTVDAKFAFDPNANTAPVPIATESSQVVDCVTAKMRYVANIAATTPAGIYTTKINYIAAPRY